MCDALEAYLAHQPPERDADGGLLRRLAVLPLAEDVAALVRLLEELSFSSASAARDGSFRSSFARPWRSRARGLRHAD